MLNKKAIIRLGLVSTFALFLMSILIIITITPKTSAIIEKNQFDLGETIRIDLTKYPEFEIRIKSNEGLFRKSGRSGIVLYKAESIGEHKITLTTPEGTKEFSFEVNLPKEKEEEIISPEFEEEIINSTNESLITNISSEKDKENNQTNLIYLDKPVKWNKQIKLEKTSNIQLKIPSKGENISIHKKNTGENISFEIKENRITNIVRKIASLSSEEEKTIVVNNAEGDLELEYYTEGPSKEERNISKSLKEIEVSSPDNLHYENVLSYSNLPREVSTKEEIRIYWKEENTYLPIYKALDTDNNSLIDYIEWIVPHLSTQTFEIIIEISKAEHLDKNKNFVEDVYTLVNKKDNNWAWIPKEDYIRVTFEKQLDKTKDITIYARSSNNAIVEVYERDSDIKIAEFNEISSTGEYRVQLTNLIGYQDTFDLRISEGDAEFDYITDPSVDIIMLEDDFEGGDFSLWDDNVATDWDLSTTQSVSPTHSAHAGSADNDLYSDDMDMSDATAINVTFRYYINNIDGNDNVIVYYYDGAGYDAIDEIGDDAEDTWLTFSQVTTDSQYFDNGFHIYFEASSIDGGEDLYIDDVIITKTYFNDAPTHTTPILVSSDDTNSTSADLIVYNQSTSDDENDNVKNTVSWIKNNVSFELINMPFDVNESNGANSTKDYSENSYNGQLGDGTLGDSAEPTFLSNGGYDGLGAYSFDGGDYIAIHDFYYPANSNPTEVTIAAWIQTAANSGIIASYDRNEFWRLEVGGSASNGYLGFQVFTDAGQWDWSSTTQVNDGNWHFVVGTFDNGNVTMYIDGVLDNSSSTGGSYLAGNINRYGCIAGNSESTTFNSDCVGGNFNGLIDDVRIYNKSLSSQQIEAIYNNRTDMVVSQETTTGEIWQACITPNDGLSDGTKRCSNNLTIISPPPLIKNTSCYDGSTWIESCTTIGWNDNIRIRTNCTSLSGGSVSNVTFLLTNIEDNKIYFNQTITSQTGGYWEYDSSQPINDSGTFNLHTTCRENPESEEDLNWTVAWGNLSATLIDPNINVNKSQNKFFNFIVNVSCSEGECGNVNASLDPPSSPANIRQVYSGTAQIASAGTSTDVYIGSSVNTSESILFYSGSCGADNPDTNTYASYLLNSTTIHFERGDVGCDYDFHWYVAEFSNGVAVQNGNFLYGSTQTATLSPAVDTNTAFPLANYETVTSSNAWGDDDEMEWYIADSTTFQTNKQTSRDGIVGWQVIEFAGATVQNGTYSLSGLTTTSSINPVNLSRSIVYANSIAAASGIEADEFGILVNFTDDSNIRFERHGTDQTLSGRWYVVEFPSNVNVYSGLANFGSSDASLNIPIGANINTSRSVAFLSGRGGYGGKSTANTDSGGHVWFTANITNSSNLLLTRATTGSTADAQWFVIEFGYTPIPKSGLISTVPGTLPFYTTNENPMSYTDTSCLQNMVEGNSCLAIWAVNATGETQSTHEFYSYVNSTSYPTEVSRSTTSKINVSIVANNPPNIQINYPLDSYNYSSNRTELNYTASTSGSPLDSCWYSLDLGQINTTVSCTSNITGISSQEGENNWTVYINNTDGDENSVQITFFIDSQSPNATLLNPGNATISAESNQNFTVNITDNNGLENATLFVYNSSDDLVNETNVQISGTEAIVGVVVILTNDVYTWFYQIVDNVGNIFTTVENTLTVSAPGSLLISLIDPNKNASVNPNEFFTFTANVTCLNGSCGDVNVTLDPVNWWDESWTKRKEISITGVGSLSNFPVYLNLTKESEMNSDYSDIRFINGSCDDSSSLLLSHEIEDYTSSKANIWVNIPSIISGQNTICLYYGNSGAGDVQNKTLVWDSDYTGVYHMAELDSNDSSLSGNNATATGTVNQVTGVIGNANDFDGSTGYLLTSNGLETVLGATGTLSYWISTTQSGSDTMWQAPGVTGVEESGGGNDIFWGWIDASGDIGLTASNGAGIQTSNFNNDGTFQHVAITRSSTSGAIQIYVNGILDGSGTSDTGTFTTSFSSIGRIEDTGGSPAYFDGSLDEVRISDIIRTQDWINQSYQLMANPDSFVSFGESESQEKGIISMVTGTIPFYTTSQNPTGPINDSCLSNMAPGESCIITWNVNATGSEGSVWEFFVTANSSNYSESYGISEVINITIENLPPLTPELIYPLNNSVFSTFTEFNWSNTTDPTKDPIYYILDISDNLNFTSHAYFNGNIPETEDPTGDTPSGISQEGTYYWRVLATDLKDNSSWSEIRTFTYDVSSPNISLISPENDSTNTTTNTQTFYYNVTDLSSVASCSLIVDGLVNDTDNSITKDITQSFQVFLANKVYTWSINCTDQLGNTGYSETRTLNISVSDNAPLVYEILCEENSTGIFNDCSNLIYGDTLTGIRARCIDPESGLTNATFNLTNTPDSYNYLYNSTTNISGDNWTLTVADLLINDSGNFTIIATCTDSEGLSGYNSTTWLAPWGNPRITLINPNTNTSVMQNEFFNFTVSVECFGGECGNINATLDPVAPWWDASYSHRREINISNPSSATLEENYSMEIQVDTQISEGFLSSGDDLRIVYYDGSTNTELDVYNETGFNSGSTKLWFRIQEDIASGNSSSDYYIYYNNSAPSTPPRNGSNVFEFFDDFNRADSGTVGNGWTEAAGTWAITSNRVRSSSLSDSDLTHSTNFQDHSIRAIANHEDPDADWKINGRNSAGYTFGYQNGANQLSSAGHTAAGLGSSAFSPTAGNDYELELSMYGTRILAYVDDSLIFNLTDSTHSSGTILLHAWDLTQFDNVWVRKFIEGEPTFSLGSEESASKGIIPMNSGEPFYTTTQNPNDHLSTSCLTSMIPGSSCNVTWSVNATGTLNSVWEFFAYTNTTSYLGWLSETNNSNKINITIVNQLAPTTPQLNAPSNQTSSSLVLEFNWTNSTDVNGDSIFYILEVSNKSDFSDIVYFNGNIPETENPTGDTPTLSDPGTYYWRVLATDLISNSSWSEEWVFYYDTSPPVITFLNQTGEDGLIINETHPLDEGENITINVDVSDVEISGVWVVIWATVKGGEELFKKFFSFVSDTLYQVIIPTNESWGTDINYTIYANDTLNQTTELDGNFTILKGNISLALSPSDVNEVSNITAYGSVSLTNGSKLGNHPINLWLDGSLLLLSNLTPQGTYDNYLEFNDTSTSDFEKGSYYQTTTDGENITLISGNANGNFTKILDASARVEWDTIAWDSLGASCQATVTFQDGDVNGYNLTRDGYIDSGSPTTNYGSLTGISVDGSPTSQRGIIQFGSIIGKGFNQVPENATIIGANITLSISDPGNLVTLYEILENWTEYQVTYNERLTGTSWSSTGIAAFPSRSSDPESSFTASSTGNYVVNVKNSLDRWTNGSSTNYGWVFDMPTSNGINIDSSEFGTQSSRPLLTVQYNATECTEIQVYIRTSNDKSSWSDWERVYSGDSISDINEASRYLEYKLEMSAINTTLSPTLKEIFVNYTAITTNSTGDFSYNFTSPLSFGDYEVSANTSLRTINMNTSTLLSVQTGVPPTVNLIDPSESYWFNTSNITLIYNASDENDDLANATLFINGLENTTNTSIVNNGAYSNFTINLADGYYNWSINVTDSQSLQANSSVRSFYVDTTAPNITRISPADESNHVQNEINLSYSVTDNLDSSMLCDIELDESPLQQNIPSPNGQAINVSTGTLVSGFYIWTVTCYDEVNNSYTTPEYNFTITDVAPSVSLVSPEDNYLDSDGNISFVFNATDSTGIVNATLIINGLLDTNNQTTVNNGINTSINKTNLPEGVYNWTVIVHDLSGTPDQASPRNFTVDLNPPAINLNLPTNGITLDNSDVNFNFTALDTIDPTLVCSLFVGPYSDNNFATNNGSLTNRLISNMIDGLFYWNVSCVDSAGHSNISSTQQITIAEPPTVTLTTDNETSFPTQPFNLSYIPSDNTGLASCDLYINSGFNQTNSSEIINGAERNFSVLGLSDGTYTWSVNCTDTFNLTYQTTERTFYIDTGAPNITLYYPNGEEIGTDDIYFNFTAIDSSDVTFSCNLSVDSTVYNTSIVSNGSLTEITVPGIPDGFHTWNVSCVDSASNIGESTTFNFTKSTPPSVDLISPENRTWFNITEIPLIYLPVDDEGFISSSLIINDLINETNSSEILNNQNNNFTINGFQDGEYNWSVRVTDVRYLNTTATPYRLFYIDTMAPQVLIDSPSEFETITTNNVTFNFTALDNLDSEIDCNLLLDGESEYQNNYTNGTDIINYILLGDGEHNWYLECVDEALNINITETVNFTVDAPPEITLNELLEGTKTNATSITFNYTPIDAIGLENCSILVDGTRELSDTAIEANQLNNFTLPGISEGSHNWTIECFDAAPDFNRVLSEDRNFTVDRTPPEITLNHPYNSLNVLEEVTFNFSAQDLLDTNGNLTCGIYVDSNLNQTLNVTNGLSTTYTGQDYNLGVHYWNISCIDDTFNVNWSETWQFNVTRPDLEITSDMIEFNNTNPKENETIIINATIRNLINVTISDIIVQIFNGNPETSGTQIGTNQTISSLNGLENTTISLEWNTEIGTSSIYVVIDPPAGTGGSIVEWNESNNIAYKNITIGGWQFLYGDINEESIFRLANLGNNSLIKWNASNYNQGKLYSTDSESVITWTNLHALGKDTSGLNALNDFSEVDSLLGMTGFGDSIEELYLDSGSPHTTTNLYIFNKLVQGIPLTNSTNSTNFQTGILWDETKDTNDEFDSIEKEDLVFVTETKDNLPGAYGTYDYEMRIPAKLREYYTTDQRQAIYYVEIY